MDFGAKTRLSLISLFLLISFFAFPIYALTAPSGAVYYQQLNIQNTQASAYSKYTQVVFTYNAGAYQGYLASNLMNIGVFNGVTGTLIPAEIAGNTLNYRKGTSLSTSNNIQIVANVPDAIDASSTDSNYYLAYFSTSNDEYSLASTTWGAAPQLFCASGCPTTTYGGADNGKYVYATNSYCNFAGASICSNYQASGTGTYAINNELIFYGTTNGKYTSVNTMNTYSNVIVDAFINGTSTINANYQTLQVLIGVPPTSDAACSLGFCGGIQNLIGGPTDSWLLNMPGLQPTGTSVVSPTGNTLLSGMWIQGSQQVWANGTSVVTGSSSYQVNSLSIGAFVSAQASIASEPTANILFIGARTAPPNGVNAVITFGSVTSTTAPLSVTISPSSNLVYDVGTTVAFNALASSGTAPYTTYNFLVYNSVTHSQVANSLVSTNSFAYAIPSTFAGNTLNANVFVTDSTPTTANSILSGTITVDSALNANPPTPSTATIYDGQSQTLTATPSGGDSPYTYQWYTDSTNNCLSLSIIIGATASTYAASPTSNTFYCYVVTDSAIIPGVATSSAPANIVVLPYNPMLVTISTPSNVVTEAGIGYENFVANLTGGAGPYTYNFLIYNSITGKVIANQLFTNVASTSNTFLWHIPIADGGNTVIANVVVTDSRPTTVSSLYSLSISSVNSISSLSAGFGIATLPSNSLAYITQEKTFSFQNGDIEVVNTITNKSVSTIPTIGYEPTSVVFNPAGSLAYVADSSVGNIIVVNTMTNSVVNTINVGGRPTAVAINPAGTTLYAAGSGISVINVATNSVINTIVAGYTTGANPLPEGLAFSPSGTYAYVTNYTAHTVNVINVASNTVVNTINVGNGPDSIAISPDGKNIFVVNYNGGTVSIANALNDTVINTLSVGNEATGITINGAGTLAFVPAIQNSDTSLIDVPAIAYLADSGFTGVTATGISAYGNSLAYTAGGSIFQAINTITITSNIYGTPTISSQSGTYDAGQTITYSAYQTGGIPPYSYSFLVFNSVSNTVIANSLQTSNTFTLTIPSYWAPGNQVFYANVLVKDSSSPSNQIANSVFSGKVTANPTLIAANVIPNNALYVGSIPVISLSSNVMGGTTPYTINWYYYANIPATPDICSNQNSLSTGVTANTLSYVNMMGVPYTFGYCYTVTDSATSPQTISSNFNNITVDSGAVLSFVNFPNTGPNTHPYYITAGINTTNNQVNATLYSNGQPVATFNTFATYTVYQVGTYNFTIKSSTSSLTQFLTIYSGSSGGTGGGSAAPPLTTISNTSNTIINNTTTIPTTTMLANSTNSNTTSNSTLRIYTPNIPTCSQMVVPCLLQVVTQEGLGRPKANVSFWWITILIAIIFMVYELIRGADDWWIFASIATIMILIWAIITYFIL